MTSHQHPKAVGYRPPAVPDVEMRGFWGEWKSACNGGPPDPLIGVQ